MNNDIDKTIQYLFSKARNTSLGEHEKAQMKRELFSYMDANPIVAEVERVRFIKSPLSHMMLWRSLPVAILLLIVGTGGLSYAAQQALPGEFLYGMKVEVNERVEGLFVSSPNAKVQFEIKLAGRRLKEAEELVVTGKLDEEKRVLIQTDLDKHVAEVSDHVEELKANDDLFAAATVNATLQNSLEAHQEAFAKISALDGARTTGSIVPLIANLESKVEEANKDKAEIQTKISTVLDEKQTTAEETTDIEAGNALIDTDTIETEDQETLSTDKKPIPEDDNTSLFDL